MKTRIQSIHQWACTLLASFLALAAQAADKKPNILVI
jgi:hypothetical protein